MKKIFKIEGMTCSSCKATVEEGLKRLPQVEAVEISLNDGIAELSASGDIPLESLQKAISSKYKISEMEERNVFSADSSADVGPVENSKSKLQQLKPLFLIIFYIAVASFLLNYDDFRSNEFMSDFMGLFFIVFSFFKLLDLKGFPGSFAMYDPLAKRFSFYGWVYPFIETALGIMFLMRIELKIALIITLIILSITTIGVTNTLLNKRKIKCACLGTALNLPMTEATFIENAIMLVMALLMLINY